MRLRFEAALPTDKGGRALDIQLVHDGEGWAAATATAREWNAASHRVDARNLSWDRESGAVEGPVEVMLMPDAWIPQDHLARELVVSVSAKVEGDGVKGGYIGMFKGGAIEGVVSGDVGPVPLAGVTERAGLLRMFAPVAGGKYRQAAMRFETSGEEVTRLKGEGVEVADFRLRAGPYALEGEATIGWEGREAGPARVELAVAGETIGGTIVALGGEGQEALSAIPVTGRLEPLADTRLQNRPDPDGEHSEVRLARIASAHAAAEREAVGAAFSRGTFTGGGAGGGELPYRLFAPEGAAKLPLVLFLHGRGEVGRDNEKNVSFGARHLAGAQVQGVQRCFVLAPQASDGWDRPQKGAPEGAPTQAELIVALLDELAGRLPVDRKRLYVTGLSMGGWGTCHMLVAHGEMFAAGAPICGAGPEFAEGIGAKPVWIFHGNADVTVPVQASREMVKALRALGHEPLYTELDMVGHVSWPWAYTDDRMIRWLFEQRLGE